MFAGLVNQGKAALSGLIAKYLARASVAVPFLIAAGFALAAITAMLIERFGHVAAYWLLAGGLAAVGVMAAVLVSAREQEERIAEQEAEQADTKELMSDAAAEAIQQAPLAIAGALLTAPGGAAGALKVASLLGRNLPLVLLLVLISVLFWPTETDAAETAAEEEAGLADMEEAEPASTPNGRQPADSYH